VSQCYSDQAKYTGLVVCFLMGNSPASEFCMPTFRNSLSVPSSYPPMKMERTVCSETLAYKFQTAGNYPEENILHLKHGENLKSRINRYCHWRNSYDATHIPFWVTGTTSPWKYESGVGRRYLPALEHHIADISWSLTEQYNKYMPQMLIVFLIYRIWLTHPTTSKAEVLERVELYLYSS